MSLQGRNGTEIPPAHAKRQRGLLRFDRREASLAFRARGERLRLAYGNRASAMAVVIRKKIDFAANIRGRCGVYR
jgi:hypothetical protein